MARLESEQISLNFNTINIPSEPASMGFSATAIDPNTARTAIASDVDHHYLLRWGSLFASSFLEGYTQAVASSGQTQTTSQGSSGTTTTTSTPPLDGRQQFFQGLGLLGSKWSEVVGKNFDRKITITIDQGTSIGLLLTTDFVYGTAPGPKTTQATAAQNPEAAQPAAPATEQTGLSSTETLKLLTTLLQSNQQSAASIANPTQHAASHTRRHPSRR